MTPDHDPRPAGAAPTPAAGATPEDPTVERRDAVRRALKRYAGKLERKLEALRSDLAEAERGGEYRRFGETLLAYAHQVPPRAASVPLADVADPARNLEIALDPNVAAPANAARYFKRAAKAERGQREIPPRIESLGREIESLRGQLAAFSNAPDDDARDAAMLELERALFALGTTVREQIKAPQPLPRRQLGLSAEAPRPTGKQPTTAAPRRPQADQPGGKLVPWRFRTREGWDVLIGRSSEGNDHLTAHMARPEDYWFHAHGCPGSHVVLRRGKGPNEPSKATLEEVASWAAFHSKARTAGKVSVHYTLKKYVRKPRGAKAGLVYIEREKALMVRPVEPPREQMADAPATEIPPGEDT
jgi:predicted ribosome quality control (RQC) complex YloA/Tae2 family protein